MTDKQTTTDTGREAFPGHPQNKGQSDGMTLLDYFAGQALAGILAYPGSEKAGSAHDNSSDENTAEYAYAHAAAMIAEKRRREAQQ